MSGWEELRREIEALPEPTLGLKGGVNRAAVLAAIDRAALSGSTAPLDVERLAEALGEVFDNPKGPYTMRMLAEIAAEEYARLAASPDPAQGEP
jgi:hypothetical protein